MKKYSIYISAIAFLLLFSCASETKKKPDLKKEEVTKTVKDSSAQKDASHVSDTVKSIQLTSKLADKVARLKTLEHQYQLKSLGALTPKQSMIFGSIQRIQKLNDSLSKKINIAQFEKDLHQIQKAFVKGAKPMYPNDNTYPRAHIEEYIFKTPKAAKTVYNVLKKSISDSRLWAPVTKSPHDLFLEENRMYFMVSGGFYMMEIYKDIAEKIKEAI